MKLLQLLDRFRKPRHGRGRGLSAAQSGIAACERVLEQRVLLSAAATGLSVGAQTVGGDGVPTSNVGTEAKSQATVTGDHTEIVVAEDVVSVPITGATPQAGTPSYPSPVGQEGDLSSSEAVGRSDSAIATSDRLEIPWDTADFQVVLDTVPKPLRPTTEEPATEQSTTESQADPADDAEDSRSRPSDVEASMEDPPGEVSRGVEATGVLSPETIDTKRLSLSQNADSIVAAHDHRYFQHSGVAFRQDAFVDSGDFWQTRPHSLSFHRALTQLIPGVAHRGSGDVMRASETVWSGLSRLASTGVVQAGLGDAGSAIGTLPRWMAHDTWKAEASGLAIFARASFIPQAFVEVAEASSQDPLRQTTKYALARLEAEVTAISTDALQSDDPPERFDIPGIWQSLKFDCNPRGPPGDDPNLISGFTRQTAGGDQLQQLRFSIAPRGPSVAFCS